MAQQALANIQVASQSMWGSKSLTDLVRGIRTHKKDEHQYIAQALQEIKEEIKQEDHGTKTNAVQKLTYLQMLGYDIGWASFHIIEVMSQPTFTDRRIGYLAASQTFHDNTEEVVLCTSLLKRALGNPNVWEAALAINCLANICTPDLARDLAADVVAMLNSSRPYLRKKAVLVLYKIFLKFQGALRPAFPRLKERLEDPDPGVVSAAVNVICELARKNPKNYLTLAPTLFKILQSSTNNWMLIKIIKLFAALCPLEKRLARRLVEPLTNLINTTSAMSLLYECIQTCIIGMPSKIALMKLCIQKLRIFVEDPDQNLKYLGLLALNNIMKVHPKAVAEHRDMIVKCLDDADETIRLRALDLLAGMITSKNVIEIVQRLTEQLEKTESNFYRDELIVKIINICSSKDYKYVQFDFEWYISVLMGLVHAGASWGTRYGKLISGQFMDIIIRVDAVREYGISAMVRLLRDPVLFMDSPGGNNSSQEVLYAAVWLVGEFAADLRSGIPDLLEGLLHARVQGLIPNVQAVYMQTILKLFSVILKSGKETMIDSAVKIILTNLPKFQQSAHLEVQERACFAFELIQLFTDLKSTDLTSAQGIAKDLVQIFNQPLNPVAPGAQKKVPIPKGLDLDQQINEPPPEEDSSSSDEESSPWWNQDSKKEEFGGKPTWPSADHPSSSGSKNQQKYSPYLLHGENAKKNFSPDLGGDFDDMPPVGQLSDLGISDPFGKSSSRSSRRSRRSRGKKAVVLKGFEWHPGTVKSDDEDAQDSKKDLKKSDDLCDDVDFNAPLEAHEMLTQPTWSTPAKKDSPAPAKDSKHKSRSKSKKSKDDEIFSKKSRSSSRKNRSHHRHSKKTDSPKSASQPAVQPVAPNKFSESYANAPKLLDFGDSKPSPSASVAVPNAQSSPPVDPFDPYGGYANVGSPNSLPAATISPSANHPAPLPSSSSSSTSRKDRKSSSSTSSSSRKHRESSKSGHRSSHRSHRDKDDRHHKKSSNSSSTPSSSSSTSTNKPASSQTPPTFAAPTLKVLSQDENLKILHTLKVSPSERNKIAVPLILTNISQTGSRLKSINLQSTSTMNAKLLTTVGLNSTDILEPGQTLNIQLIYHIENFIRPQQLSASLHYSVDRSDKESENKISNLQLNFPCFAFILPVNHTVEQYMDLVSSLPPAVSTCSVSLKGRSFEDLIKRGLSLGDIKLAVVEFAAQGCTLYGLSIQEHHVCILAKLKSDDIAEFQVKCSDSTLGSCLSTEISNALQD